VPTFNSYLYDFAVHGPGPYPLPSAGVLASVGAVTPIDLSVPMAVASSLASAGQPVPPSATGVAMLDTGASLTCVHEPLLTGLGLHPVGSITSGTAAGQVQQSLYVALLSFPQIGWIGDLAVVGVDLTGQQVGTAPPQKLDALIGRNLLQNWTLVWHGSAGHWSIST
jgi:hypothetical protein